jgi:CheY-like chemotaxis protein
MPEFSGYQVAQMHNKVPLVAVTAHIESEVREKCMEAGFKDVTVKPFDNQRICEIIAGFIL